MADQCQRAHAQTYRERLSPGFSTWLIALGSGVACFFVAAPISVPAGYVVGVVAALIVGVVLFATSPIIEVTEDVLRVGRAQIERKYLGHAEAFRGEEARIAAGPALDGRAFMCFRGWIQPKFRVEITDPADPTPYWIASSRHPERVAAILNTEQDDAPTSRHLGE